MHRFMLNSRPIYWLLSFSVSLTVFLISVNLGGTSFWGTFSDPLQRLLGNQRLVENQKSTNSFVIQEKVQDTALTERDRIDRLSKYLTGTRWTGQFTVVGVDAKPPAPEQYEILEANKAEEGDNWNLVVRIKYGDNDVTMPLPPLEIKWAGETPVITVDRLTIPTMGTFDARVLIRRGQYAGTWAHDNVGGHLFGTIEKLEDAGDLTEADQKKSVQQNSEQENIK